MRYSFASEHLHFFKKEHYICFSDLLSPEQITLLKKPLKGLYAIPTPFERYLAGRDLFRHDRDLKSIILRTKWAEMATTLFKQPSLRLAYTQYICGKPPLEDSLPLKSVSAFTRLSGALVLNLLTGEVAFLSEECPLSKTGWLTSDAELLCVAYMHPEARYILVPDDPCTHVLKKLGYGFGDTLENDTHPLLST